MPKLNALPRGAPRIKTLPTSLRLTRRAHHLNILHRSQGSRSGCPHSSLPLATGFPSQKTSTETRDLSLASRLITSANPSAIETVLPKLTATGVSGMGFTAVETVCSMRARFPICGRWHRRHMIRLTLAAIRKGAVIIFAVRTHTETFNSLHSHDTYPGRLGHALDPKPKRPWLPFSSLEITEVLVGCSGRSAPFLFISAIYIAEYLNSPLDIQLSKSTSA